MLVPNRGRSPASLQPNLPHLRTKMAINSGPIAAIDTPTEDIAGLSAARTLPRIPAPQAITVTPKTKTKMYFLLFTVPSRPLPSLNAA